jgi:hypothetical protein
MGQCHVDSHPPRCSGQASIIKTLKYSKYTWVLQQNMMGIQNLLVIRLRHRHSGISSCCIVATLHPDANVRSSLNFDCEKLYHTINGDPCHMKGQLRHKEGMRKGSSTVVNSVGSSHKVTGEILCCDRIRDRSRTWIIQSGSHKTVTGTGIKPGPSHANQGNLYSPANVIAISCDGVTLENTLENGGKS